MTSVDLLAEIRALNTRKGSACPIGKALTTLPPDKVAALEASLLDPEYQSQAIETWLRKQGLTIGKGSCARHRNGACKCPTT